VAGPSGPLPLPAGAADERRLSGGAPLPLDSLPPAPEGPTDDVAGKARHAVTVLVRELNEILTPIVRQLECVYPQTPT
jgi:hypothetical protein